MSGRANRHRYAADPLRQLRGSVLHYDDPFSPVADGEWEGDADAGLLVSAIIRLVARVDPASPPGRERA
jgi:hypothetical protein